MIKASILHTEETCLRLALVQDKCYGKTRLIVRVIIAMIPVVIAYFAGFDTAWGAILIAVGIFFYYTTGFMYERDAAKALAGTPEKYRDVDYYFHQDGFTVETGDLSKNVPYSDIYSLVSDGIYHYIFINPQQAYMMEVKKDKTRKNVQEIEPFLTSKTGKTWKTVILRRTFPMYIHDQIKKLRYGTRS